MDLTDWFQEYPVGNPDFTDIVQGADL